VCLSCLPLAGDLPASKTHAVRRWTWVRRSDPHALEDGVLTITLRRSAKPGAASDDDSYAVAEQPEAVRGWRRFFLVNLTDRTQKDVYEVVLGGRGDTCTCDAGKYRVPNCKHRDALRAVVRAGGFARDPEPAPLAIPRVLADAVA